MNQDTVHVVPEPSEWDPTAVDCYKNAWRKLRKYFLSVALLYVLFNIILSILAFLTALFIDIMLTHGPLFSFITWDWFWVTWFCLVSVYYVLILGPLSFGISFAFLKAARGDKSKVKDVFEVFQNYLNAAFVSALVVTLIALVIIPGVVLWKLALPPLLEILGWPSVSGLILIVLGLLLLIIPGIVLLCRLAFLPYLVVDRKMAAVQAFKESWRTTKGYAWKVFFILSLVIPIALASVLLERIVEIILEASGVTPTLMPFIFIIFSIPVGVWVWLALASLYHVVSVSRMVVSSGTLPLPNRSGRNQLNIDKQDIQDLKESY